MTTEHQAIATMEALIAVSRQAAAELRGCAAAAAAMRLRSAMLCRADEYAAAAGELSQWLDGGRSDGKDVEEGRAALRPQDGGAAPSAEATAATVLDEAVLTACDAAERRALKGWRQALERPQPEPLRLGLQDRLAAFARRHRRTQVLLHVARYGDLALLPDEARVPPPSAGAPVLAELAAAPGLHGA